MFRNYCRSSPTVKSIADDARRNGIRAPKDWMRGIVDKNINPKVFELEKNINRWLGKDTKFIKNKAGDPIFISKDGTKRIRFDFNRTLPHKNQHSHVKIRINDIWNKSGPIYPK